MNSSAGIFAFPRSCPMSGFWASPLEWLLGLRVLGKLYESLPHGVSELEFLEAFFHSREIEVEAEGEGAILAEGPMLVVANHPFGGIEGMALALLLMTHRTDVRVMANRMLMRIPELRSLFLAVNPFGGAAARQQSVSGLRASLKCLDDGGALVVFPAGEVSHPSICRWKIEDPEWSPSISRLQLKSRAAVLPIHVEGRNRLRFHLAGFVHPRLRSLLLIREFLAFRKRRLRLTIGRLITDEELRGDGHERMAFLRRRLEEKGVS